MFFDRISYKERGKEIVKTNFWILVLASFVANLLGGNSSFNFSSGSGSAAITIGGSEINYKEIFDIETGEINYKEIFDVETGKINYKEIFDIETGKINEGILEILGTTFAMATIILLVTLLIGMVYNIFVGSIIQLGKKKLFLENVEDPNETIGLIFDGFTGGKYMQRVKVMLLYHLRIWLGYLLFLIPGIIASYKYYLVPYIVAENPDIDIKRALELSKEMTNGHKFDIFVMELSFLGWLLLSGCCTCGILTFWVNPYMESSFAVMYTEMKNDAITNGIATADEFVWTE